MTNKFVLPEIETALKGFVYADKVKEILSLSYSSASIGKPIPVLLYGRGGHGKSEMVREVFKARERLNNETYFIQSFGEGMSESRIYGGVDLKALNCTENPRQEYKPEWSFMNFHNSLLEELYDAPPIVLLSLKNTLTSRKLDNGHQTFEMKTLQLIAATNRHPGEIAEMGSTYEALVERFPLQVCVEWDSYKQEDFYRLYMTADNNSSVVSISSDLKKVLAGLIADAHSKGQWISPRQAMVCLSSLRASATIQGRTEAKEDDLWALKFIPGTDGILDDLAANLERVRVIRESTEQLDKVKKEVREISKKMDEYSGNLKLPTTQKGTMILGLYGNLNKAIEKVSNIRVPDSLTGERNNLQDEIIKLRDRALETGTGYLSK
jgi:MoxR-like ATPase